MKGRFLPLWCVAVFATAAAFVVHLAIRFETEYFLDLEIGRGRLEHATGKRRAIGIRQIHRH